MQHCDGLVFDNISLLVQGIELVSTLGSLYTSGPPVLKSGIGSHFRHCIDFYNCFLQAVGGRVNYDLRRRSAVVDTNAETAVAEMESIIDRLRQYLLADGHLELKVVLEGGNADGHNRVWARSSVARELQSLLSHTVHHYALIALALKVQGIEVSPDFGVAPSTLDYWRRSA